MGFSSFTAKRKALWTQEINANRPYLELVDFHCDVMCRALVCEKQVFKCHPALAVLHLPADLLQLHQQPRLLLVVLSVGLDYFIVVDILAGAHMGDFCLGDCKNKLGP